MIQTDAQKIIERIQKLLSMAADKGSPHEAEIAARRASSLMEKHNIEMADVIANQLKNTGAVKHDPICGWHYRWGKYPPHFQILASQLAHLFDCEARFTQYGSDRKYCQISVYGYETDIKICQWTFNFITGCLTRDLDKDWKLFKVSSIGRRDVHYGDVTSQSFTKDFMYAAIAILGHRIHEMKEQQKKAHTSTGTSLIVLKKNAIERAFGEFNYNEKEHSHEYGNVYAAHRGAESARNMQLGHRPIEDQSQV